MIGSSSLPFTKSATFETLPQTSNWPAHKVGHQARNFVTQLKLVGHLIVTTILMTAAMPVIAMDEINYPGGIATLEIPKKSESLPTVRYGLTEPAILARQNRWLILIGLDLEQLPGEYILYTRQAGEDESAEFLQFQVRHKHYPIRHVSADDVVELPDYEKISDLDFSNSQPPELPMLLPFEGEWNDDFGRLFLVEKNKEMLAQNHTWASATASSLVRSPQAGIIAKIVTNDWGISNLVLDHGRGVYSILHGLDNLTVELGNGVVAGAVLGKIPEQQSTSSRANKANRPAVTAKVHWQVQLNGVFVNPLLMTQL